MTSATGLMRYFLFDDISIQIYLFLILFPLMNVLPFLSLNMLSSLIFSRWIYSETQSYVFKTLTRSKSVQLEALGFIE